MNNSYYLRNFYIEHRYKIRIFWIRHDETTDDDERALDCPRVIIVIMQMHYHYANVAVHLKLRMRSVVVAAVVLGALNVGRGRIQSFVISTNNTVFAWARISAFLSSWIVEGIGLHKAFLAIYSGLCYTATQSFLLTQIQVISIVTFYQVKLHSDLVI